MYLIKKLIEKHAKQVSKGKPFQWEKLGKEVETIIRKKEDSLMDYSRYNESRRKQATLRRDNEAVYFHYFAFFKNGNPVGYDWVNGNEYWKELVNSFKTT